MRSMRISGSVLFAVLWGCSDTFGGGGAAALTVDTFPAAYYRAICTSLFRCAGTGDTALIAAILESPAVCAQRLPRFTGDELNDLLGFVRAGSVRFDAAAAQACLDRVSARCITEEHDLQESCSGAFTGTVPVGGTCWRSAQCANGGWCDHGSSTMPTCPGTCRAPVALGAMCNANRQCLGSNEGTAACVGGRCTAVRQGAPASEGQRCGNIEGADMSVTRTRCAENLACRSGMCRRIVAAGAPCNPSMDVCAAGTVCVERPGGTPACTSFSDFVRNMPGQSCNPMQGRFPLCNPTARLVCNETTQVCESLGDGSRGARCLPGDGPNAATCNEGLRCDPMTRTCVDRVGPGGMCQRDTDCLSGECQNGRCLEHFCN
jgi:hypothetical protein